MKLSISLLGLLLTASTSLALQCFSCSSNAGDRYCHEDSFNPKITYTVTCPSTADVCVRAIQISNGNGDEKTSNAGAVFRSCGSTNQTDPMEELILGYYPPKNRCIVYKVGHESALFNNSVFEICATTRDMGNGSGDMKFDQLQRIQPPPPPSTSFIE